MLSDSLHSSRSSRERTRRDVLAAALITATTTSGCLSSRGVARGLAGIRLYNPTARSRDVQVVVIGAEREPVDEQVTVPPRATLALHEDVLRDQTVEVRVTHDDATTVYEWDVQSSLDVVLGPDRRFVPPGTAGEERPGGGRVDVRLEFAPELVGAVEIARDGEVVFEAERTYAADRSVRYHDRLDATGEVTATVQRQDTEVTERLSLTDAVAVFASADDELSFEVLRDDDVR